MQLTGRQQPQIDDDINFYFRFPILFRHDSIDVLQMESCMEPCFLPMVFRISDSTMYKLGYMHCVNDAPAGGVIWLCGRVARDASRYTSYI